MDLSNNNQLDLLYLTNPNFKIKYNKKESILDAEDVKFYRKRILQSTKDYLREKTISNEINHAYELYVSSLIGLYKFTDKQNLIQEEYKDLPIKKKNMKMGSFKLIDENKILIKNQETIKRTIKDFIPIVVTERKKKYLIIPKKKEYNIRNPINRNKKKEKSNLIISDAEKNETQEEKFQEKDKKIKNEMLT
jgi:hypothetical protein